LKMFYVASSFKNIEAVQYVSKQLIDRGFIHTYDWTRNERASTFDDLKEIGQKEKVAVIDADFIIVLLPAGKGSHIELGIALGLGKRIYLHSPDGAVNHFETTSTFYHLPEVRKCIGSMEDLIDEVMERESIAQSVME
jgi:hypothetical protein